MEQCASCRKELESYRARPEDITIPTKLREALQEQNKSISYEPPHSSSISWISEAFSKLLSGFRGPLLATASAAAIIFLVVIIYPGRNTGVELAFTSLTWEQQAPPFRIMAPKTIKPKVAPIILLRHVSNDFTQKDIDRLYQALKPCGRLKKQFQIIDPAEVGIALRKARLTGDDLEALLGELHKQFGDSMASILEISGRNGAYHLAAGLWNVENKQRIKLVEKDSIPRDKLDSSLKILLDELLLHKHN